MPTRRITLQCLRLGLARVLTVVAFLSGCGDRSGSPASAPPQGPFFEEVSAAVGVDFAVDRAGDDYFMPDVMGTGCAWLDYDGDDDLDLYLVNGFRDADGTLATPRGGNRLYRQEADGRFTDVTADAGLGDEGYGMGVAVGDVDNDGDPDLYVTNLGPDRLYRNEGEGSFVDVTATAGIDNGGWSTSAGFFDADGDGLLDLYVCNYVALDPSITVKDKEDRPDYPGPVLYDAAPDVLYRNRGDGSFVDVSASSGIAGAAGKGLGLAFVDLDEDHRLDIYVANDGVENNVWLNDGAGGFTDKALSMGLATNAYAQPEASMGIAYGDFDGDARTDILLTHLFEQTNTLYRRIGPGIYADLTITSHLVKDTLAFTGFGAAAGDFDLDGDLDFVIANGRVVRADIDPRADVGEHWAPYAEPNQLLLNDGVGGFATAGAACGAFCDQVEVSRGLAVGDIDRDGDLDVAVANGNGSFRVYRNVAPRAGNHWLVVRALDPALSRDAIGAVVQVKAGRRTFVRHVRATHSYLSSSEPRAHFGLGSARKYSRIEVRWPQGEVELFPGGPADRAIEIRRGEGRRAD